MRLLILGGSWSLGKLIVDAAVADGIDVTICNSGKKLASNPNARLIPIDRSNPNDLAALTALGPWDTVLDIAGKNPGIVAATAEALRHVTGRMISMSSILAYRDWPSQPVNHRSPIHSSEDAEPNLDRGSNWSPARYGRSKAECERTCLRIFGEQKTLILRLGTIIGQAEDRDPMQWWINRVQMGGNIIIPAPDRALQPIDVRDLAEFTFRLIRSDTVGTYNAVSAPADRKFADLIAACQSVIGATAQRPCTIMPIDEPWLIRRGVREFLDIPLWHAGSAGNEISYSSSYDIGLSCRNLADSARFVWDWFKHDRRPPNRQRFRTIGLSPEQERDLIDDWKVYSANLSPRI